jgi:hypothetical protein
MRRRRARAPPPHRTPHLFLEIAGGENENGDDSVREPRRKPKRSWQQRPRYSPLRSSAAQPFRSSSRRRRADPPIPPRRRLPLTPRARGHGARRR